MHQVKCEKLSYEGNRKVAGGARVLNQRQLHFPIFEDGTIAHDLLDSFGSKIGLLKKSESAILGQWEVVGAGGRGAWWRCGL